MEIKVCGPGCAKCDQVEKIVMEAVTESGLAVEVQKVTDFRQIAALGVFSTPAVLIDGRVRCVGTVPSRQEVLGWLKQ